MKMKLTMLVLLLYPLTAFSVEYKAGWDYKNFYNEVEWCNQSVLEGAVKGYKKAARKAGVVNKTKLKNEVISMLPLMEETGKKVCYCAINEIAKVTPYAKYKRGQKIKFYIEMPLCKQQMLDTMSMVKKDKSKFMLK